ncbi:MAG: universal stress protein [Nitrospira sp. CG24E]|nr:MAG: universal stress protein [Nitrospira sp. CG24E]
MNVLVATDGSKYGRWGLDWVAMLPFVEPPRVTALYVLDLRGLRALRGPILSQVEGERYRQEEIQCMEARSAKALKEARQQFASLKLKGTARKEHGAVAPTILKRAPKRDGLLVVGSKGLDALDRFMLGSVSTDLIQQATCPVFVVKDEAVSLRRITLAIDGSDASAKALAFVLAKFQPDRSTSKGGRMPIQVTVIHVMPFIKYPELKEIGLRLVEQSVQKLTKAGFMAEAVCQLGKPAEAIMKVASKHRADLIVMGAQGLGAIARFLLGSVSTRVVQHSSCSVLVVR